jgi:hypothetical protein
MARKTSTSATAKAAQGKAAEAADTGKPENETPASLGEQGQDAAARQSAAGPAASQNTPEESDAAKGVPETAGAPDMAELSAALTSEMGKPPVSGTRAEEFGSMAQAIQPIKDEGVVVIVIGPKQGLWRAGRHFTSEPVRIPAHELSDEHAAMLRDEPKLAISLMQEDPEPE